MSKAKGLEQIVYEVSVVIPAWDVPLSLAEALRSLEGQVVDTHIIIVDNCSTQRIKLTSGPRVVRLNRRVTLGQARNKGLSLVETPYVIFLDADDLLLPNAVSALSTCLKHNDDATACVGKIQGWRPSNDYRSDWGFPPTIASTLHRFPNLFASANLCRNMFPVVGATLLKSEAVRRAGGFSDSNRGEDWGLSAVLAFLGPVRSLTEPTLVYRVTDSTLSTAGESLRAIMGTRREVRRRVRASRAVPYFGRLAAAVILPVHWIDALRRRFHRHSDFGLSPS